MTTLHLRKSIGRSPLRLALLLIPLVLASFALLPTAQAQLPSPAPDGGYPNGNTAEGTNALFSLTTGTANTANGNEALLNNTTGNQNTANGAGALQLNTTGSFNTASGVAALASNTTANDNTANGYFALEANTGSANTATGSNALLNNTTGYDNTATGAFALYNNTTNTTTGEIGHANTATGSNALFSNTSGTQNTATGSHALFNNTGSSDIALGANAGFNLTTGSNNIDIGNVGVADESKKIRIGVQGTQNGTFIAGISGSTVGGGTTVVVNPAGKLGVAPSSARFKQNIRAMDNASEAILALKPVTFHYKKELDPEGIQQFGLVAEEVEKVNPHLVVRDQEGKPYTVRYEAVNAMLLNEFLKEHRTVEELKKQVAALTAGLQKVTAQIEASKPATQVVNNNQ